MTRWLRRLSYVVNKRRLERELEEELAFHRAATGDPRAFGSTALAQNQARDVWIPTWLQDLAQDVRFAARLLRRDRRLTLAIVATLALAIAANNTVFTFINAGLIRELPFDHPEQIVQVGTRNPRGQQGGLSIPDFLDWREASHSFSALAISAGGSVNLGDEERAPERLNGAFVSASTFHLLGREPFLGRAFTADDDKPDAPAVVLVRENVWRTRYAADPSIVGRQVRVNGVPATVVGVMRDDFKFPNIAEVWQPFARFAATVPARRDARFLSVVGRLADGVTREQARAELNGIAATLARQFPQSNAGVTATVDPMLKQMRQFARPQLLTMMGAAIFVLLIACANVANLLLARAATRSQEIAIRASLGATRWRIVRQLLLEGLALASLASIAGAALSTYSIQYFGVMFDIMEVGAAKFIRPYWVNLSMNGPVFAFLVTLGFVSTIGFALVPALHLSRADVNDLLKQGSRTTSGSVRTRRWTSALMIGEVALTLVLLTGAGLLARSFYIAFCTDTVIKPSGVTSAGLALSPQQYRTVEDRRRFFAQLDRKLATMPNVAAASVASVTPFVFMEPGREVIVDGRARTPDETPQPVRHVDVGDRYFETIGLGTVRGRTFVATDSEKGHEGAIVDQKLATSLFGDGDPIGHRIQLKQRQGPESPWLTIVGVVPTLPRLRDDPFASIGMVYMPFALESSPERFAALLVRSAPTSPGVAPVVASLREQVRALDRDLPIYAVQPMEEVIAGMRASIRMMGTLFGLVALIAIVVTTVGVYALTAQGVAQRTHEIGVRVALGALTRQVVWMFLRRTLMHLAIGLTLGLAGAMAVGRLVQTFLVNTGGRDPLTITSACAILMAVALVASAWPARRAAHIDPAIALRTE